jgi:hypothetical protein
MNNKSTTLPKIAQKNGSVAGGRKTPFEHPNNYYI